MKTVKLIPATSEFRSPLADDADFKRDRTVFTNAGAAVITNDR